MYAYTHTHTHTHTHTYTHMHTPIHILEKCLLCSSHGGKLDRRLFFFVRTEEKNYRKDLNAAKDMLSGPCIQILYVLQCHIVDKTFTYIPCLLIFPTSRAYTIGTSWTFLPYETTHSLHKHSQPFLFLSIQPSLANLSK
jgi:hypothetical protein